MLYTPQKFINYGQLSSEDRENRGIDKFFAIQLQCTYKMAPHHILKRKKKTCLFKHDSKLCAPHITLIFHYKNSVYSSLIDKR